MGKPGLYQLIVRKEHVACVVCGKTEPVHPGDGTPAETFIMALEAVGERHAKCQPPSAQGGQPK